jgi:enterochelin esterase-like enzyme
MFAVRVALCAVIGTLTITVSQLRAQSDVPESPTMRALAAAGLAGRIATLEAFWEAMRRTGTPLLEPTADSSHSLLTFLYRGDERTRSARVASNLDAALIEGVGTMIRLPGTDIWHRSYRVRNDLRIAYRFEVVTDTAATITMIDSLNPKKHAGGTRWEESLAELPAAPDRPWRALDSATGRWVRDSVSSAALGGRREIWVYLPRDHDPRRTGGYPAIVASGPVTFGSIIATDRIVDHLRARGRIRPTIVVLVEDLSGASDSAGYDPAAAFLADDVVPRVRTRYQVSRNPADLIVTGTSRRGLIAGYAAFRRPEVFGNALTLSGSFYWHPPNTTELEWLARLVAMSDRRPVTWYVTAGVLETVVTARNAGHYLLATNRHIRDVLVAKGYDVQYREFYGAHSEANWEDALADGLRHLGAATAATP